MTPEIEVVAGSPDETELAAILAVGLVAPADDVAADPEVLKESVQAATGTKPADEWVRRIRSGGARTGQRTGARVPGVLSDQWSWSLRR